METVLRLVVLLAIVIRFDTTLVDRASLFENKTIYEWFQGLYVRHFRIPKHMPADMQVAQLDSLEEVSCVITKRLKK